MALTRLNCPNCRQPISAEITQLFDMNADPNAKQILLSGAFNLAQCPHCGYQGSLAAPLVYHDPEKELLLTFVPAELGLPRDEQERLLGSLINRVVNQLPQEKRKGYLLRPVAVLTMQGLVERVLEADGITKEMLQDQQKRINLIQRLLTASDDALEAIVEEEQALMDSTFFSLFQQLAQVSAASGDEGSVVRLAELQQKLLPMTEFGKQLQEQSAEVEAAMDALRQAGRDLTREKLLDLLVDAPNETRLGALVSLTRSGLDYEFFQILSERIEQAPEDHKEQLKELRATILEMTSAIDQQVEQRRQQAHKNLELLLGAPDLRQATLQNLRAIDDYFVEAVHSELEVARKNGDLEKSSKLNEILQTLEEANKQPELELIEELLSIEDDEAVRARLTEMEAEITPEFMELLMGLVQQTQSGEAPDLAERIQKIYRMALRMSMEANLNR
jgi:hypothetical protein